MTAANGRHHHLGPADLVALARTGIAAVGLGAAAGTAVGVGLLNRSRREAANLTASAGTDVALALAGVHLRVTGEDHLWSRRPAIFIFNHQSALDVLVMANLLRRDLTGVVKREAAHDPRFVVLGALGQVAYVDRRNHDQAVTALDSVVARLREGVSIAIAPQGTRSPTLEVGRFKKGAFRMAMQAGVPLVPVVLRNTGELMGKGSWLVHPGTVDVTVLESIDVSGWSPEDLDVRIDGVRRLFVDTLACWPV
jgi:putative phosphoserine phosphatase/1-acylglycerol-3-phosphate O-acyltransferase